MVHGLDLRKHIKGLIPPSNSFLPHSLLCSSQAFPVTSTFSAFRTISFPMAFLHMLYSCLKCILSPSSPQKPSSTGSLYNTASVHHLPMGIRDTLVTPARYYVHRHKLISLGIVHHILKGPTMPQMLRYYKGRCHFSISIAYTYSCRFLIIVVMLMQSS